MIQVIHYPVKPLELSLEEYYAFLDSLEMPKGDYAPEAVETIDGYQSAINFCKAYSYASPVFPCDDQRNYVFFLGKCAVMAPITTVLYVKQKRHVILPTDDAAMREIYDRNVPLPRENLKPRGDYDVRYIVEYDAWDKSRTFKVEMPRRKVPRNVKDAFDGTLFQKKDESSLTVLTYSITDMKNGNLDYEEHTKIRITSGGIYEVIPLREL